jgi:hypothetical protein
MNLPPAGSKTQPLFPISPRSALAGSNHIDLGPHHNVALNEIWQPIGNLTRLDFNLAGLPAGLQTVEGILFDIRGIVRLRGAAPDSELYPERVMIPVERVFNRFHVLHGTTGDEADGREISSLELHYAGGALAEMSVRYGEHARYVTGSPVADCSNARLAWRAELSAIPATDRPRVYQATFLNPRPEVEVVSLDYVSKVTRCSPFLLALTVE